MYVDCKEQCHFEHCNHLASYMYGECTLELETVQSCNLSSSCIYWIVSAGTVTSVSGIGSWLRLSALACCDPGSYLMLCSCMLLVLGQKITQCTSVV